MDINTHDFSFDGKGINGPDQYRSRIATFANAQAASAYGQLFAAAPDMLEALQDAEDTIGRLTSDNPEFDVVAHRIRAAIAKATGGTQ